MDASPFADTKKPLRFRTLSDSLAQKHLEASECCLIHADNPLSSSRGVWVNPAVRVGHSRTAYLAVNPGGSWPSHFEMWIDLWKTRLLTWLPWPNFRRWSIGKRVQAWKAEEKGRDEPGQFCIVDETQVLKQNGWTHV